MPPASAPRLSHLHWRSLVGAAAVSLALAGALLLSAAVRCALGLRHAADMDCQLGGAVVGSLGVAVLLWLGASLTQPWLPRGLPARNWALSAQVIGLTWLIAQLNAALHAVGPPNGRPDAYTLQILLTFSACVCIGLEYRQRGRLGLADAERLRSAEQDQARQLDAARAALLQAQIEPHFLFNTLDRKSVV